ncbi:hypothetical protein pb186bvf_015220 [Paramecium bursaria]
MNNTSQGFKRLNENRQPYVNPLIEELNPEFWARATLFSFIILLLVMFYMVYHLPLGVIKIYFKMNNKSHIISSLIILYFCFIILDGSIILYMVFLTNLYSR